MDAVDMAGMEDTGVMEGTAATADTAALDALLRDVQTGDAALAAMLTELAENSRVIPPAGGPAQPTNDPAEEWQGMPEFDQPDVSGIVVHVHMHTEADVSAFEALIGDKVIRSTNSVWFPRQAAQP